MTGFRVEELPFDRRALRDWAALDPRYRNWPVVYTLNGSNAVYVGESINVAARFRQHLDSPERSALGRARVVISERFNKSVCLDLESYLIRLFAGDGKYQVLNRNEGIVDADYFDRDAYYVTFRQIFDELLGAGLFTRTIPEIENTDLFKLSPFKALSSDQAGAVEDIVEGLFSDIADHETSPVVVQGDPGTGKTVVAIYLMKLLSDIARADPSMAPTEDSMFSDFFLGDYPERLRGFRMALVVPQQSLRKSIQRVFRKTPGLSPSMVLSTFNVGTSAERFDLLVVDEAHRLGQRAAQPSAVLNLQYTAINERLFGDDDLSHTQLDWIRAQSDHQVLMIDGLQSVKPADLPASTIRATSDAAESRDRRYRLRSQHRVQAGSDYVGYVRQVLSDIPPEPEQFEGYDLRFFDDVGAMRREVRRLDEGEGLARMVAGYAWPWASKTDKTAFDIELDGEQMRWNSTAVDWVSSPTSVEEVGSIHTIQGYDLNYAGVIIGRDLRLDPTTGRIVFDRSQYFDANGKKNNGRRGITYSDDDILQFVRQIYVVLLTRGIRGTFIHVVDPALREYLRPFFPPA